MWPRKRSREFKRVVKTLADFLFLPYSTLLILKMFHFSSFSHSNVRHEVKTTNLSNQGTKICTRVSDSLLEMFTQNVIYSLISSINPTGRQEIVTLIAVAWDENLHLPFQGKTGHVF